MQLNVMTKKPHGSSSGNQTMKLNIREIQIERCPYALAPSVLESESIVQEVVGLFDHLTGLMEVHYERDWPSEVKLPFPYIHELIEETREFSTLEEKLDYLLKRTAVIHELRHFHDCFCTPYGFQILSDQAFAYAMLHAVAQQIVGSRGISGLETRLPILRYIADPELPQPLRPFWDVAARSLLRFQISRGSQPILQLSGLDYETDFYLVSFRDSFGYSHRIVCAHCNIMSEGQGFHVLWPVNFTLIAEALALLEQESYLTSVDERLKDTLRNRLKSGPNTYIPMIATLVRILKNRGVRVVTDEFIYEVLYRSLFVNDRNFAEEDSGRPMSGSAGWEVVHQLENYLEVSDGNTIWEPPKLDRSEYIRNPELDLGMPLAFSEYVRGEYLNKALQIEDRASIPYTTKIGYTAYFSQMPRPPIVLDSERMLTVQDDHFYELWHNAMLYRAAVSAIWFRTIAVCPVRAPGTRYLYPREYGLPSGDVCRKSLAEYKCGVWKPGTTYSAPVCMWTHYMSGTLRPFGGRFEKEESQRGRVEGPWIHRE